MDRETESQHIHTKSYHYLSSDKNRFKIHFFIVVPILVKQSRNFPVSGEISRELRTDIESCLVDCLRSVLMLFVLFTTFVKVKISMKFEFQSSILTVFQNLCKHIF